ncbi:dihydrolipoamide acetyltransferase family protein [Nocardioides kribbensis]|uniref:dihydrolipoamide acetyltransferase family protein n=1 Tax=Nocardioides kribbensis TaxID=305517 RepID=UPI00187A961D|nr:dihydrolipoamide acetyltransferase family protein [Nocardioides kribbensis]
MARLAIRMPKMSMTMTEGEVSSWMVKVGDAVETGDVVCEVMTDKVDMEVESTVSGTLVEIVVETGLVDVGEPIAWVEGEDDGGAFGDLLSEPDPEPEPAVPSTDPGDLGVPDTGVPDAEAPSTTLAAETRAPLAPPEADQGAPAGPVAAVPRARALARQHGIDLGAVTGTGPEGLVRVGDIEALVASATDSPAAPTPATPAATADPAAPAPADPRAPSTTDVPSRPAKAPQDRRTAIRVAVARAMAPSAAVPQFTVWRELRLDAADARRGRLSWTTVLLRAYAASLREVPELLSRWEDGRPGPSTPPSIALAVATDRGLLVPTFTEPDVDTAADLDGEIRAVVTSAHAGRLDPSYMGLANASLSNLGGMGVDRFQALLTPPQASVLSLGGIAQRPVAVPGGVGLALTLHAGLTVDHRVADGAHAAQLLERIQHRLDGAL